MGGIILGLIQRDVDLRLQFQAAGRKVSWRLEDGFWSRSVGVTVTDDEPRSMEGN